MIELLLSCGFDILIYVCLQITLCLRNANTGDGEQRRATGSRAERSEACTQRKESGGGAPAVPMREDKAACPRGTVLTGGDRH
jgi:hypothetical protein